MGGMNTTATTEKNVDQTKGRVQQERNLAGLVAGVFRQRLDVALQGLQMRATVGVTGNFRGERSEAECPRQADQGVARERGHSLRSGKTGQQRPEVTGLRTLKYTGRACTDLISGTVEDLGQPLDDGLQQAEQGRRAAGDI